MKALRLKAAIGLAKWWVHLYTLGVDHATADARRAELESDLWEGLHDDGRRDGSRSRSLEILDRLVRGLRADLAWCFEERRVARRARADTTRTGSDPRASGPTHGMDPGSPRRLGGAKASLMASLLQDLRVALRSLRRSPGFTLVAILTLALGIGANTAIFSVVEGVLLRPLPYPDADRLVRVAVQRRDLGDQWGPWSDRGYWHFANNNRSFEAFGALWAGATNRQWPLTHDGPPVQVDVAVMTASAFEVIGRLPQRGRFPSAEEDVPDGPAVALISDGLWVNRYGSDPSIIGRTIELNGITREVIGVMPARLRLPQSGIGRLGPLPTRPWQRQLRVSLPDCHRSSCPRRQAFVMGEPLRRGP